MLNFDELDILRTVINDDPEMSRSEVIRTMEDMLADDTLPMMETAPQYDVFCSALSEIKAMSDAEFASLDISALDDFDEE